VTTVFVGLSRGDATVAAAEHWIRSLVADRPDVVACTHLVREPVPHVAVSLAVTTPMPVPATAEEFVAAARTARAEHVGRSAGRAVLYPGMASLVGTVTVSDVLTAGAIERVTVLGGDPNPSPSVEVDTRDFVRPQWMDGRLTLVTLPAPNGRIAPFELPNPVPCCADHG
jgi:hypothetical protein